MAFLDKKDDHDHKAKSYDVEAAGDKKHDDDKKDDRKDYDGELY